MISDNIFDVIIVGGSYAGLAAGMALGRAMKKVLIIDDGKPCNRQTPYSHNFLTNDGKTPAAIAALARLQLGRYETIKLFEGFATGVIKTLNGFELMTAAGELFAAKKIIFATGIRDILPGIDGVAECWGISVLHCPYCHGYEVRYQKTGIIGNGDMAFDFIKLVSNWTADLTLFTNGTSLLTTVQREKLQQHKIAVIEKEIVQVKHTGGNVQDIVFRDGTFFPVKIIYAPGPFEQHCKLPGMLGCQLTAEGYIETDNTYETTVEDVFAIGDNSSKMRTVANAVAMGTAAGIMISKKMILEAF
ncbi:MAG: NAD(P)/FAD-dependent oxidoreductase [Ferruginibacter sp.]